MDVCGSMGRRPGLRSGWRASPLRPQTPRGRACGDEVVGVHADQVLAELPFIERTVTGWKSGRKVRQSRH